MIAIEARLRPVNSYNFFAIRVNGNCFGFFSIFDEVGWIDDWICVIFFPLLQIFAIVDSLVHGPDFSLMLIFLMESVLIFFYFIDEESFHIIIVVIFIIDGRFVVFIVEIGV